MLQRTPYKTAADLGLNPKYYEGLLMTLHMLKTGEITAFTTPGSYKRFNMAMLWREHPSCGSVGCICGWAQKLGQLKPGESCYSLLGLSTQQIFKYGKAHAALVYPTDWNISYKYSVEDGIRALESYLLTGKADWSKE